MGPCIFPGYRWAVWGRTDLRLTLCWERSHAVTLRMC